MALSGIFNALNDVGHCSRAVGPQDFDSVDVSLFGNAKCCGCGSPSAVGSVAISVNIFFTYWDSGSPECTSLEINMLSVDASIDDVNVDAFTCQVRVEVCVEGGKVQGISMTDPGEAPWRIILGFEGRGMDLGVFLDKIDLGNGLE